MDFKTTNNSSQDRVLAYLNELYVTEKFSHMSILTDFLGQKAVLNLRPRPAALTLFFFLSTHRQPKLLWPIWRASMRTKRPWWPRPWWNWGTSSKHWRKTLPPFLHSELCLPHGKKHVSICSVDITKSIQIFLSLLTLQSVYLTNKHLSGTQF